MSTSGRDLLASPPYFDGTEKALFAFGVQGYVDVESTDRHRTRRRRQMLTIKTPPGSTLTPERPREGFEVGPRTMPARVIRPHGEHPETIEPEPGQEPPLVAPRYSQELRR